MKPYYEHAGITIYHGAVVKCDAWTQTNERGDTERDNAAKMCQSSSADLSLDSNNQPSTSQSVPSGEQITPHGSEMPLVSAEADQEPCASSETLDRAAAAEPKTQSAIISTATPQITGHQTSLWSAEPVTCKSTDASKSSENLPSKTSLKLSLPAGVKPYYLDERNGIAIFCGDCREILPGLPKADAVITDPPYGVGNFVQVTGRLTGRGKSRGVAVEWNETSPDASLFRLLHEKSIHRIIWGANYFNCFEDRGGAIIWDKCQPMPNFSKADIASCTHFQKTEIVRIPWTNFIVTHKAESDHPCERPVELYRWCIEYLPNPQTILDPFMGSGTTLVAAKNLGRKAIGIEIEERYCEIAAKRLAQEVFEFSEVSA